MDKHALLGYSTVFSGKCYTINHLSYRPRSICLSTAYSYCLKCFFIPCDYTHTVFKHTLPAKLKGFTWLICRFDWRKQPVRFFFHFMFRVFFLFLFFFSFFSMTYPLWDLPFKMYIFLFISFFHYWKIFFCFQFDSIVIWKVFRKATSVDLNVEFVSSKCQSCLSCQMHLNMLQKSIFSPPLNFFYEITCSVTFVVY